VVCDLGRLRQSGSAQDGPARRILLPQTRVEHVSISGPCTISTGYGDKLKLYEAVERERRLDLESHAFWVVF